MALKPDRRIVDEAIDWFMNEVAERGGIVSVSTAGSGAAMDQGVALATYAAEPSGINPLGLLLNDMVSQDLTRVRERFEVDEITQPGKVTIAPQCTVVTDQIYPGHTPTGGGRAYVGHSGLLATSDVATDHVDSTGDTRIVGRFQSVADELGYVKVTINMPR